MPSQGSCARTAPHLDSGLSSARPDLFPRLQKAVNQRINSSGGIFPVAAGRGLVAGGSRVPGGEAGSDCGSGAGGASGSGADGSGVGAGEGTLVSWLFSPSAPGVGPEARGSGGECGTSGQQSGARKAVTLARGWVGEEAGGFGRWQQKGDAPSTPSPPGLEEAVTCGPLQSSARATSFIAAW